MDIHASRFQALASYAASLGPDGLRQVMADQLTALVGLATGYEVAITTGDLRRVEITAETPKPGDPLDSVLTFRIEARPGHTGAPQ